MKEKRFYATYSFKAENFKKAKSIAFDICVEQTVEFPFDLIENEFIKNNFVGKIEKLKKINDKYFAKISYHNLTAGLEFTQFLNVLFGNTSIKKGIKLESFELSDYFNSFFKGPRFGINGLRKLLNIYGRPIICSALKPMGLSTENLANLALKFASGGIDIIKDDHGLANQPFSPFKKRVIKVTEKIKKFKTIYTPNITADSENEIFKRAYFAKKCGAGGVVISGFLCGIPVVKKLSEDKKFNLPIFFHPAFMGSFTSDADSGISHSALYGQLSRLSGADAIIFPNFGGRFSFTKDDCRNIISGCKINMGKIKPNLPAPGGGISLENIKNLKNFYGNDVIFLIGGGLFKYSKDIIKSCQEFKKLIF